MHRIRKKMAALIALLCLTSCAGAGSGAGTTKKDGTLQSRQTTDINDPFTLEETVPDDTTPDEEFSSERIYTYRTYENGAVKGKSLDEIEKEYYLQVRSTPFDRPSETVKTQNGAYGSDGKAISSSVCLDGGWQLLAAKGSESYYYTEEMLPSDLYSKMNIVGLPVEASSQYTALGEDKFMPSGINDGAFMYDGADDWVSAGPATDREPWFIIDLTETRSINGFILYSFGALGVFDGSDRPENTRSFTVSVSIDKKKWKEIYDTSSNTASIADVRLDKYYDARYLMVDLNQTEQTAKGYARIIEFELYGKEKVFSPSQLDWKNAYNVTVPGSVPGELHEAGVIDNPYFDHNDGAAREAVGKTWWLKRDFDFKPSGGKTILSFDGICDRADVWINNVYLGFHQGMYGGPEFDVTDYIVDGGNTVVVRLYPVVGDWTQTVAFNISYGWTQVNIPPLGIWQSVHINSLARIEIIDPFIAAADTSGNMDFCCDLQNTRGGAISGTLIAEIIPKNFRGETCFWTYRVDADKRKTSVNLSFDISEPKLWWPNGVGEQNLYLLKLRFVDNNGAVQSEKAVQFGIRTIEMRPLADVGAYSDVYNWTFVINGREMFLHGCNWYPIDALLNFTEEHYGRNIALARNQGVQLLRAWGNGTVETERIYDLCDENGIFV
ncbi:MAG: discoidin domain-containing protein, partial [Clostridia bacterium]|nr:discoidin domain-containing protein [Clostridia bacterium]